MPIAIAGELNKTALVVPDVYVEIVPPQVALLNGVPTDILGMVGVASWGPTDSPVTGATMTDYALNFGPITTADHDMGSAAAQAVQQGAQNFRWVRVTDGTDVAASIEVEDTVPASQGTFTARWTGSLGNQIVITIGEGSNSKAGAVTYRIVISMPGREAEIFDNIGIASGETIEDHLWARVEVAINQGQNALRGPSQIVRYAAPTANISTVGFAAGDYNPEGGTDGNAGVVDATLLGDEATRTGLWALADQGCSNAMICQNHAEGTWASVVDFGKRNGCYMHVAFGSMTGLGDTIADQVSRKKEGGWDTTVLKIALGDHVLWFDSTTGLTRTVSPQAFFAGRLANLSPEQSSLNKPMYGIVGTERSSVSRKYSHAEIQQIAEVGIDAIVNPVPGGNYFGARVGHNASTNPTTNGDNYTRLTNYIARTLEAGMGIYIGRLHLPRVQRAAKATVETFLSNMVQQEQIEDFSVIVDDNNNPPARKALGFLQIDVKVRYLSVIEKMIINVEGGQSVTIQRVDTQPLAA